MAYAPGKWRSKLSLVDYAGGLGPLRTVGVVGVASSTTYEGGTRIKVRRVGALRSQVAGCDCKWVESG